MLCYKCAVNHKPPVGENCSRKATEARILRSNSAANSTNTDLVEAAIVAMSDKDEGVAQVEMDEEEQELQRELRAEEAKIRKIQLRARIATVKKRADDLEKPPTEKPAGPPAGPTAGATAGGQLQLTAQAQSQLALGDKESKYGILRYLPRLNDIRNAQFDELILAALEWALHNDMTMEEMKGYLMHLAYICYQHIPGIYPPVTSVEYDAAVRVDAETAGMKAFGPGNYILTMRHYGIKSTYEGLRMAEAPSMLHPPPPPKKKAGGNSGNSGPKKQVLTGADNACLLWNYHDSSCPKGNCKFPHICKSCGGDHRALKCTKQK